MSNDIAFIQPFALLAVKLNNLEEKSSLTSLKSLQVAHQVRF